MGKGCPVSPLIEAARAFVGGSNVAPSRVGRHGALPKDFSYYGGVDTVPESRGTENATGHLSISANQGTRKQGQKENSSVVSLRGSSQPPANLSTAMSTQSKSKQKHKGTILPTRQLPLRDSRVAACLQNQIIAECERSGWRSSSKSVEISSRKEGDQDKSVANKATPVRKQQGLSAQKSRRVSDEWSASPRDQITSQKKTGGDMLMTSAEYQTEMLQLGKHNIANLRPAKQHLPKSPPPSETGRPRRRAADRAMAAIAAASDEKGGFLVLEWPPLGSFRPSRRKSNSSLKVQRKIRGAEQKYESLRAAKRVSEAAVGKTSGDESEGSDVQIQQSDAAAKGETAGSFSRREPKKRRGVAYPNSEPVIEVDDSM